jgi:hypothetical protein
LPKNKQAAKTAKPLKIENVLISGLKADPNNARSHNKKNVDVIAESLKRFGQQKPIVVDSRNVVLAGNGTVQAAKQLGWEHIDICRTSLDGSAAIAFALADNRSAELASWDTVILGAMLDDLKTSGVEMSPLGFELPVGILEDGDEDEAKKISLSVSFKDTLEQQTLFLELRDRGYKVKAN